MRSLFAKILKRLRKNFPDSELELVRHAYRVANEAHQGQKRLSGEPYIIHSLSVGLNLAVLGLDPVTCSAGLLHDVLEDSEISRQTLHREFGSEITQLVDGVTKIRSLGITEKVVTREEKQAQNLRKMLVATAQDVRVILIKLADRVHNMRTIDYLPEAKRERIAQETLDIYAPLAHRLGISRWKWELEDHAFHVLQPEAYREVARQVAMKRRAREAELTKTIDFLEERLMEAEVTARVIGRPKHLYSIYQKMMAQGKDFRDVLDIQAVRIITQTESGCYNALGVIHNLWPPIPGRLKDYIAMPKLNMYQAIHTTVMRENGCPMEVQIRSEDMDRVAREGIAAHWVYKEGKRGEDPTLDKQLQWLRQMYEWLKDTHAPEELMENVRADFRTSHLYAFTPKGEVKELPIGATPLDFAYAIHSDIGHHCIGARVNNRMVPLRYHLQTGDMVEILTSKNQTPHLDWTEIVVTGRARTRIRQRLRELGVLDPVEDPARKKEEAKEAKEAREAKPAPKPAPKLPPAPHTVRHVDDETRYKMIRVEGSKGMAVQFAKCCQPMPGHAVIGYVTRAHAVTIHRADCRTFVRSSRDPSRVVEVSWEGEGGFESALRVVTGSRPNALADITNMLRPLNIDILRANFHPAEDGKHYFDFVFEAPDRQTVNRAVRALQGLSGVSLVAPLDLQQQQIAAAG